MPGVKIRFWPCASALLIACTLSLGFATKNRSIGIDVPAAGPLAHVVPDESWRTAGTKTLYFPSESTYRNGRSRVTGLVGSVVYGGFGNDCAGAPCTPENTWFQT